MSTIDRETEIALPPLMDGQRLDRATFHGLYEAMDQELGFELIGGIVYMAAAAGLRHGWFDSSAQFWLGCHEMHTPGVESLTNASVFFEDHGEPQPDAVLRILPECGGRTRDEGKYYAGGPELVVEVSDASLAKDLGPKLADYERAGVLEYVVMAMDPYRILWHVLREGRLVEVPPDPDGIHRSAVFPGLWLDPAALLARDKGAIQATVDLGVATPEHAGFVARLAAAGGVVEG